MTGGESFRTSHCRSELPSVIPNGVRNLRSPCDGLPITTTVFRVRRRLRDSLIKSLWMRRMDVKPVPTEGRGSRLRGNDGLQASCSEVPYNGEDAGYLRVLV